MLEACENLVKELCELSKSSMHEPDIAKFDEAQLSYWYPLLTVIMLDKLRESVSQMIDSGELSTSQFRKFMSVLDRLYGFDKSQSCEIQFKWLLLNLLKGERKAEAAKMASSVGRMKYTRPLYRALSKVDLDLATRTFLDYENTYHPICKKMVRTDLKKAGAAI